MRFDRKIEDIRTFKDFEESKRKLEHLISVYSVNLPDSNVLNEVVKRS